MSKNIDEAQKQRNIQKARDEWQARQRDKMARVLAQVESRMANPSAKGDRTAAQRTKQAQLELAILTGGN